MRRFVVTGGLIAFCAVGTTSGNAQDLKRGALLYQTCAACHSVLGDGVGPDITGILGQKAATRPGFDYSAAMRASGLTWDEATLRQFIKSPQALVPATKMTFTGYPMPADVEDVLVYIKSLGTP